MIISYQLYGIKYCIKLRQDVAYKCNFILHCNLLKIIHVLVMHSHNIIYGENLVFQYYRELASERTHVKQLCGTTCPMHFFAVVFCKSTISPPFFLLLFCIKDDEKLNGIVVLADNEYTKVHTYTNTKVHIMCRSSSSSRNRFIT